jgi:lipopolysaccharide export system protein LptC
LAENNSGSKGWKSLDFIDVEHDLKINRGYTVFIKILRKSFVAIALLLICAVVFWLFFFDPANQASTPAKITPEQPSNKASGEAALLKAQYDGVDVEQRPYRVTADKAVRSTADENLIDMIAPVADIFSADESWLAALSKVGNFNQETSTLVLRDDVKLFYDHGIEFSMPEIKIDLKQNTAMTDEPVEGHGAQGKIKASGLRIENAGQKIIFNGPATLTLYRDTEEGLDQ